jgi:hypothetical protein
MTGEEGVVHKRRRTPAEIEQVVGAYRGSGLNRSLFCQQQGLTLGTLNRYLKRMSQVSSQRGEVGLVAVELCGTEVGTAGEAGCGLTVVLRGGRRIEVSRAFEEPVLRRLVYMLERM